MSRTIFFDFDGTITRQEVLPLIAREIDLEDEIATLTRATMDGLLDFRKSFRLRCRLLAAVPISRVREIVAAVELDEAVAGFIRRNRERCVVVTGNLDCWIGETVRKRLGCRMLSSRADVDGDTLTGVAHILDKGDAVRAFVKAEGVGPTVAVGDGMNDVSMLETADLAVAYAGLHQPCSSVVEVSKYVVTSGGALCRLLSRL
jgi:phosphoserine phosphatase